jgi:hypothetical protein
VYKIEKKTDHLLVRFEEDFGYNAIRAIIHHVTMMQEYSRMDDIWLIGKHHADIRLNELELMVREFHCHCPRDATRKKTAVVAEQGFTQAILELWVNGARKKVSFEMQIFQTLEEAEAWLGVTKSMVA